VAVENEEPAKSDAPVEEVGQRHRGRLTSDRRRCDHRSAIFHRSHELSHLARIAGALEQRAQFDAGQTLGNPFVETISIDDDEIGAELSYLAGRILTADYRQRFHAGCSSESNQVVTDG